MFATRVLIPLGFFCSRSIRHSSDRQSLPTTASDTDADHFRSLSRLINGNDSYSASAAIKCLPDLFPRRQSPGNANITPIALFHFQIELIQHRNPVTQPEIAQIQQVVPSCSTGSAKDVRCALYVEEQRTETVSSTCLLRVHSVFRRNVKITIPWNKKKCVDRESRKSRLRFIGFIYNCWEDFCGKSSLTYVVIYL